MIAVESDAASLLNVPEPQSFNDPQSALTVESNLQSQQYQNFIQTLYRHDKDNLQRVNTLFSKVGSEPANPRAQFNAGGDDDSINDDNHQPTYADYIKTHPFNYIGISQDSSKRLKRSAQGAIFRPLFVYRIFQERMLKREEKRRRRRLQEGQHHPSNFLQNEFEY